LQANMPAGNPVSNTEHSVPSCGLGGS
jgi:hypothetical protein